jgi:1-acyl-sn-glycerol-3-phosphate acyltransferase
VTDLTPSRRPRLRLSRANHEAASGLYKFAALVAHIVLTPWGRRDWRHMERLPQTGGVLLVCNHISQFDPVTLGDCLIWSGRWPRYLAKISLFRSKVIGWLLRATESVPVDRASTHAGDALGPAAERLAAGKAVVIYPEGTETQDPELWPMTARTGAARLALTTGVTVVPIAQWGAHKVLAPSGKFPKPIPGQVFSVLVGDPVDLSEFEGQELTRAVLDLATTRLMDAVTRLLEDLRGETAPADRWNRAAKQRLPVKR